VGLGNRPHRHRGGPEKSNKALKTRRTNRERPCADGLRKKWADAAKGKNQKKGLSEKGGGRDTQAREEDLGLPIQRDDDKEGAVPIDVTNRSRRMGDLREEIEKSMAWKKPSSRKCCKITIGTAPAVGPDQKMGGTQQADEGKRDQGEEALENP